MRRMAVFALTSAAVLVGCATNNSASDSRYAQRLLAPGGGANSSLAYAASSIEDYRPDSSVEWADGSTRPISEMVVLGKVSNVSKGYGYTIDEAGVADQHPFDDGGAAWRTMVVTVDAESVTTAGGVRDDVGPVTFGMRLVEPKVDFDRLASGLRNLGEVAVVLERSSAFRDVKQDLGPAALGEMFGEVLPDGTVAFPTNGVLGEVLDGRRPRVDVLVGSGKSGG